MRAWAKLIKNAHNVVRHVTDVHAHLIDGFSISKITKNIKKETQPNEQKRTVSDYQTHLIMRRMCHKSFLTTL